MDIKGWIVTGLRSLGDRFRYRFCNEQRDVIISSVSHIYKVCKVARERKGITDQEFILILVDLKNIEKNVSYDRKMSIGNNNNNNG